MKASRSFRFVAGGSLLLLGMVKTFQSLRMAGQEVNLSTILLCLIAGCCLLGPGRRMFRNLLGTFFLVMFFAIAPSTHDLGNGLLAMSILILAAILFSETLSQLAARPLTSLIDGIYFGNNSREVPPLTLRLARWYRRSLRFDEALQECERQLEYHPRSLDLWCELIHTARETGDPVEMEKWLRKARRRLGPEDRAQLDFEFGRYLVARV